MTKFRWHRGSLADSMATVVEVADQTALTSLVNAEWGLPLTEQDIHVQPYTYDDRIGWDTHLVTVLEGGIWVVAGMTDGPLP